MSEKPILFSVEMVRAILNGTKTQTRRIMKLQPDSEPTAIEIAKPTIINRKGMMVPGDDVFAAYGDDWFCKCPYGGPGDRLWVRESWACIGLGKYVHRATDESSIPNIKQICNGWKPSIHMPRSVSRLTLEITDIAIEPLGDISEEDARAEGVEPATYVNSKPYKTAFFDLWDSINGSGSSAKDPWVWVIHFKRIMP